MAINTQNIRIDLNPGRVIPVAHIHQNDTNRQLTFELYNNGAAFTPPSGSTVKFAYKSPIVNGQYSVITGSSMVSGAISGNIVTVTLSSAYTKVSGVGLLTMIMTTSGNTLRPVNIKFVCHGSADGDDSVLGASDWPVGLYEYMDDWLAENEPTEIANLKSEIRLKDSELFDIVSKEETAVANTYTDINIDFVAGEEYVVMIEASKTLNATINIGAIKTSIGYVDNPIATIPANESYIVFKYVPSDDIDKIRIQKTRADGCIYTITSYLCKTDYIVNNKIDTIEKMLVGDNCNVEVSFTQGGLTYVTGSPVDAYNSSTKIRSQIIDLKYSCSLIVTIPTSYKYNIITVDKYGNAKGSTGFISYPTNIIKVNTGRFAVVVSYYDDSTDITPADFNEDGILKAKFESYPFINSDVMAKVWGKNILKESSVSGNDSRHGLFFAVNDDNTIIINGTSTNQVDYYILGNAWSYDEIDVKSETSYIVSFSGMSRNDIIGRIVFSDGTGVNCNISGDNSVNFKTSKIRLILRISANATFNNYKVSPMIRVDGFSDDYECRFNEKAIARSVNELESAKINLGYSTAPNIMASYYNGIKFAKEIDENVFATINPSHINNVHDGTLVVHNNIFYAIYVNYPTPGGDSAVNPNAIVKMSSYDISGNLINEIIIAQSGEEYDDEEQTGGAGTPNAIVIGDYIYILYVANMNNMYTQMMATYNIASGAITYHHVKVDDNNLNINWINDNLDRAYSTSGFVAFQANTSIATDGTYYYIGWIAGTEKLGKALIFRTTDFINWEVYYVYNHSTYPIYEMPIAYNNGYLYYAVRPSTMNNGNKYNYGVIGKVRTSDAQEVDFAYYPNCSSRPSFFELGNHIYLFTNPITRGTMQIYDIKEKLADSMCIVDACCAMTYPSFVYDETSNVVYVLRSDNYMQISKFQFILTDQRSVQTIIQYKLFE